ncbi:MAG: hypothetical protein MZV63_21200 [Marinilabiliales bacterium]|nr:hypothetical protein [Marinilabiliales bacterium]
MKWRVFITLAVAAVSSSITRSVPVYAPDINTGMEASFSLSRLLRNGWVYI